MEQPQGIVNKKIFNNMLFFMRPSALRAQLRILVEVSIILVEVICLSLM